MIIAFAEDLGGSGGIQRSTLEVCSGLHDLGHELGLLYGSDGPLRERWLQFAPTQLELGSTLLPRREPIHSVVRLARANRFSRRHQASAIYTHSGRQLELGHLIARSLRVPHIHHARTRPPANPRLRRMAERLSALVAVSQRTLDEWSSVGAVPLRRKVVPNGVDLTHFTIGSPASRVETRRMHGIPERACLIGYFGRIDPVKGLEELFDAWSLLSGDNRRLMVVGGATALARSQQYLPAFRSRIEQTGALWLDHVDDVAPLMQACDVVAVPSHYEPFGRVVIEALACGVPVVASRVGGMESILEPSLSDHLVPPEDANRLADGIARSLQSAPDRSRLRSRAEDFSLEACVSRVDQIFLDQGVEPSRRP